MKIFALLITLALASPAWAEELRHFPGWKINKVEETEREDGIINSGPEYYGLTPPDQRPAVTIDARTARSLRAGEAQPEEVYGRLAGKSGKTESGNSTEESYEYSAGNNGFVQADSINSTLPGYVAEVAAGKSSPARGGDSFGVGDTASYGGSGASVASAAAGGVDYPGTGAPSAAAGYSGTSGGLSEALRGAAAAASPAAAQAEARAKAKQLTVNSAGPDSLASNGLNVKSGFNALESGGKEKGKDGGKNTGKENDRTPASDNEDVPPPCNKGRFVYESATRVRVKLPVGCGLIHISAWGAGGGNGLQLFQSGGGDSGPSEYVSDLPGGGASFMSTSWVIDARKYDLIVVVGEPGGSATKKTVTVQENNPGDGGPTTRTITTLEPGKGGGPDGEDGGGSGGGGGGGYSGVFLVAKNSGGTTVNKNLAMAIGAGGSGGGSGGSGGNVSVPSSAPDARMSNQIGEKGSGTKAGFHYYFQRGNAGSPGNGGKVILEYY